MANYNEAVFHEKKKYYWRLAIHSRSSYADTLDEMYCLY